MKECYHNVCDDSAYNRTKVNFASMDMLEKVTQTTINLLLDVSDANCVKTMPNNRKVFFPPINLVYTPRQHGFN